jgi:hypothetical protein
MRALAIQEGMETNRPVPASRVEILIDSDTFAGSVKG